MNLTLDRPTDGTALVKEIAVPTLVQRTTGYRISSLGEIDLQLLSLTDDVPLPYYMVAVQQDSGSFLPACCDDFNLGLEDFLLNSLPHDALAQYWNEDELTVMPPLFERTGTFLASGFSFGLPIAFGLED